MEIERKWWLRIDVDLMSHPTFCSLYQDQVVMSLLCVFVIDPLSVMFELDRIFVPKSKNLLLMVFSFLIFKIRDLELTTPSSSSLTWYRSALWYTVLATVLRVSLQSLHFRDFWFVRLFWTPVSHFLLCTTSNWSCFRRCRWHRLS